MWGAGFASGIGVGFALGLVVGRVGARQKPWSELTVEEKKTRKAATVAGSFLLFLGIVVFILLRSSR